MAVAKAKRKPAAKTGVTPRGSRPIPELAKGVGVSDVTIHKYIKRGCPRDSVAAVQKWRSENIKAVAEDADVSEIGIELKRAEMAERWENARTRQLRNDEKAGRLIQKADVELNLRVAISRLVNRLNSLGLKCANICPSELKAPVKNAIEDTIRTALKELSDDLRAS